MNTDQTRSVPTGAIVAVGDSFAVGSEVSDEASWPAFLERALEELVVNARVLGAVIGLCCGASRPRTCGNHIRSLLVSCGKNFCAVSTPSMLGDTNLIFQLRMGIWFITTTPSPFMKAMHRRADGPGQYWAIHT